MAFFLTEMKYIYLNGTACNDIAKHKEEKMNEKEGIEKNPKFQKILALGVAAGVVIGVLLHNVGLWVALGTAVGAGLGYTLAKSEKA